MVSELQLKHWSLKGLPTHLPNLGMELYPPILLTLD
jgi:hypothetical protein